MNKALYFVTFAVGGLAGAASTYIYFKKKYEKIANEEIESVKEVFAKEMAKNEEMDKDIPEDTIVYDDRVATEEDAGYIEKIDLRNLDNAVEEPYVIPPDEFGELEEYEKLTLTYYADNVLTDDSDDIIYEVDNVVGEKSLETFGKYEEDAVYVRNEKLRCDYEILKDNRTYDEVCGGVRPYTV